MKKIPLFIILVLQVLLPACNSIVTSEQPLAETDSDMTITFTLNGSQTNLRSTNTDFTITHLHLLICDQEQRILEKVFADYSNGNWTAKVKHPYEARFVHFIANYDDWDNWDEDSYINKDVRLVLAGISTDKYVAWQQVELTNGITSKRPFEEPIELICNFAKFTVKVENGLTDVSFAIYNYDRGTIAPFDPSLDNPRFDADAITVPYDAVMKIDDAFKKQNESYLTFESDNANAVSTDGCSCMIIKGKYSDGNTYYYKIALLDNDGKRINIRRNRSYHITINNVVTSGHTSLREAIESTPDNTNFSLDPALESYPSISDGLRRLSVDRTFVLFTDTTPVKVGAIYEERNESNWVPKNEMIHIDYDKSAIKNVDYDSEKGELIIIPQKPGSRTLKSKVRVKVQYDDSAKKVDLYRIINVEVIKAFQLNVTATSVKNKQGSSLEITIQIPESFPKELLPLDIHFKTNNFFPDDSNEMRFTVEDRIPVYTYIMKTKEEVVRFKSNIGKSAETIYISAPNCKTYELVVENNK